MGNLAVIPARGGSKRIPHKNVKEFDGLPLVAYSIKAALDSGIFEKVIVSTDDDEIAQIAKAYGAQIPFMRDKNLADDFTGTHAVTLDAMQRMLDLKMQIASVCCIYATAPLLTAAYLKRAYEKFSQDRADYLYACCEYPFPIQRAQYLDKDGTPTPVMPQFMSSRSQDLPKTYQDCGMFYFYSPRFLRQDQGPYVCRGFEMPRYRVIDIDTKDDWIIAQAMAKAVKELNLE